MTETERLAHAKRTAQQQAEIIEAYETLITELKAEILKERRKRAEWEAAYYECAGRRGRRRDDD